MTRSLCALKITQIILKKDQEIEDWRDRLDDVIKRLSDPTLIWRRQRDALVQHDVPTLDILKLENAYVRSVIERNSHRYEAIARSSEFPKDLRAIANSLIASGIFKILFS